MPFPPVDRPTPAENFGKVVSGQAPNGSGSGASATTVDKLVTAVKALIEFLTPFKDQPKWQRLPFNSDWNAVAATITFPQCTRDPLGRVELAGGAKTVLAASTTIGVLQIGWRPKYARTFSVGVYNGARTNGTVDVGPDGTVKLVSPALAANIEVYLDGIRFDTRV